MALNGLTPDHVHELIAFKQNEFYKPDEQAPERCTDATIRLVAIRHLPGSCIRVKPFQNVTLG
jgi:hypothetical protein